MDISADKNYSSPVQDKVHALLSSLTPWEVLEVRRQLRHGIVPIIGLAGLHDLPYELVGSIGLHLSVGDVLKCRLVSRAWRDSWMQTGVIRLLCRYRFPGLLALHSDSRDVAALFLAASIAYLRRYRVRDLAQSDWTCHGDRSGQRKCEYGLSGPSPDPSVSLCVCCDDGLVAWQPGRREIAGTHVHVDNVRAQTSQCFGFGASALTGHNLELKAIGKKLLVMLRTRGTSANRVLHVVHHQAGHQEQMTLPAQFETCYIHDESIIVVTQPGSVVMWTFGKKSLLIEEPCTGIDEQGRQAQPLPGVLFHPARSDVFFLVRLLQNMSSAGSEIESRFSFLVTKYENGKPSQKFEKMVRNAANYSFPSAFELPDNLFSSSSVHRGQTCQKINAYGLYMLAIREARTPSPQMGAVSTADSVPGSWVAECFNTASETFHHIEYEAISRVAPVGNLGSRISTPVSDSIMSAKVVDDYLFIRHDSSRDETEKNGPQVQHFYARVFDGQELGLAEASSALELLLGSLRYPRCKPELLHMDQGFTVMAFRDHYWYSPKSLHISGALARCHEEKE